MKIKTEKEDKEASRIKRAEIPYCERCDKKEHLAVHHIFSRGRSATRYLLENLIVLCPACHTFSPTFSAHRTPDKFKAWIRKKIGLAEYKRIEKLSWKYQSRSKAKKEFWIRYSLTKK